MSDSDKRIGLSIETVKESIVKDGFTAFMMLVVMGIAHWIGSTLFEWVAGLLLIITFIAWAAKSAKMAPTYTPQEAVDWLRKNYPDVK